MPLDVSGGFSNAETGSNVAQQSLGAGTSQALNSIEQFITPIRIQKLHPAGAPTPGFRAPSVLGEDGLFGDDSVGPTLHELDPYFPQNVITGDDGSKFMEKCDYRIIGHDGGSGDRDKRDMNIRKFEDKGGDRKNINVAQTMAAVRGPLIMSGWGFGMDDLPTPQKGASYPNNMFFDQDLADDRAKWKTGPVHLMWDDERQVWQGGYHIVCGVATETISAPIDVCSPTSFNMRLFRNTQHMGGKLSDVTDETITVYNRDPSLEQEHVANAVFVIAIKLNYEWIPLWVGCPETPACGEDGQPPVPACIDNSTCPATP